MVSMKDIANACGVSVATVSKALNDYKDVGTETKEYIRQVAKEMGYFPNSAAKALKTNRTYNLGVLFIDDSQSGLTHDYFCYVLDSFKRTAEEKDYDITFINCSKMRKSKMSYLEHAKYRGFDGVIIACIDFENPEVMELVRSEIPVVTIDYVFNGRIGVLSDNISGVKDLMHYVYDKGHRKIAFVHGTESAVAEARLKSFYHTAYELGLEIPDEYILPSAFRSTKESYSQTIKLLELENPPTCILYPDDFACYGGITAIQERGLRVSEDISVVGYDGIQSGRYMGMKLTTLKQDTERIGSIAAQNLISLIEQPKATLSEPIMVKGEVLEGNTVADLNASQKN